MKTDTPTLTAENTAWSPGAAIVPPEPLLTDEELDLLQFAVSQNTITAFLDGDPYRRAMALAERGFLERVYYNEVRGEVMFAVTESGRTIAGVTP